MAKQQGADMPRNKSQATEEFRRIVKWIALVAVLMVVGALAYLNWMGTWSVHAVIATILGVFLSVLLGCGLFALAFHSDKSGHDDDDSSAAKRKGD
jgi:protein-S-isoprenylcysteine O-methyltransferase Ste14